jgi:hypothetical protein
MTLSSTDAHALTEFAAVNRKRSVGMASLWTTGNKVQALIDISLIHDNR